MLVQSEALLYHSRRALLLPVMALELSEPRVAAATSKLTRGSRVSALRNSLKSGRSPLSEAGRWRHRSSVKALCCSSLQQGAAARRREVLPPANARILKAIEEPVGLPTERTVDVQSL